MRRWILGLATLWPLVYIAWLFITLSSMATGASGRDEGMMSSPGFLLAFHGATMLLIIVLTIVYLVDAYGNSRLGDGRRTFWALVLFFGSVFAMPFYWWLYVRPTADAVPS